MSANPTTYQYEPLRVPKNWGAEEKKLILQLTDIFDDIYRRYGRLRFEDMGNVFRNRIISDEGNISEIEQTAENILLEVGTDKVYRALSEAVLIAELGARVPPVPMAVDLVWYDTTNKLMKRCTAVGPPIVWEVLQTNEVHTSHIDIQDNSIDIGSTGEINIESGGSLNLSAASQITIGTKPLEVGGTNLVPNSDFTTNQLANGWTGWTSNTNLSSFTSQKAMRWNPVSAGNSGIATPELAEIPKAGDVWTISFEAGSNVSLTMDYCYILNAEVGNKQMTALGGVYPSIPADQYRFDKYTITVTFADNYTTPVRILIGHTAYPAIMLIRKIQVEKGTMATDWSPAPSDPASGVKTSKIEIGSDFIDIESGGKMTITAPTTLQITSGATDATAIAIRNDTDYFISAGHLTQSSAPFWVKKDGSVKATAGTIGEFAISSGILQDASSSGGLLKLSPADGYILMGGRLQLYTDENDDSYIHHTATDGTILFLQNTSSSIELYGRQSSALRVGAPGFSYPTVSVYTELYVSGVCSASSFYDFTPSYSGNALSELALVADKYGEIDHSTLPVAAQVTIKRRVVKNGAEAKDDKGNFIEYEESGRDIGMMVSILTKAVQELTAITQAQQKQINGLLGVKT